MNKREIRDMERASIYEFLMNHREYLTGRVLDFGCGLPGKCIKPQPYRGIVGGEYVPYDLQNYPEPEGKFDAILCTQVLQYLPDPLSILTGFHQRTKHLVMTYPTHWEEVEGNDLWRFTRAGMESLLRRAGFKVVTHQARWSLPYDDFKLVGGYGVIAES